MPAKFYANVGELVEQLSKLPPEMGVYIPRKVLTGDVSWPSTYVELIEAEGPDAEGRIVKTPVRVHLF